MYVTLAELADRPGATELAQVATPLRYASVAPELLDAMLRGEALTAWPAEDVQIGAETLDVINSAAADADAVIDGYLARRYTLPLARRYGIVTTWARAITRYLLHRDRSSLERDDAVVRDYSDALKFLGLTADGKFSLGEADPSSPAASGRPDYVSRPSVFGRGDLGDF